MLPAAASLKKQGANKGATTAFLIATPESGIDSIAVTYALLDPLMTIVRPVAAFCTAMIGGILENTISFRNRAHPLASSEHKGTCCEDHPCMTNRDTPPQCFSQKLKAGVRFALIDVWGDIAVWFFTGVVIAGLITALIPEEIMHNWLGGGLSSMLLMLLFGIPLYICATASTPVAAALILKGVSPGTALVFLLVGPATNITSLSVLIAILGKKSTLRYLCVVSGMAVIFGLAIDSLYVFLDISPKAIVGTAGEIIPHSVQVICTLVLVGLSIRPLNDFFKKMARKIGKKENKNVYFQSDFPTMHDRDKML